MTARSSLESDCSFDIVASSLTDCLEFQATCFFVRNYAWEGDETSRGPFDYVMRILHSPASVGQALIDAIIALGLAGISMTSDNYNPRVAILAKERYNQALAATNAALRTEEVAADQSIAAVMLLGLIEVPILRYSLFA